MPGIRWMAIPRRPVFEALLLAVIGVALWEAMYCSPGDPKDLRFIGWKLGVYPLDPNKALETMVGAVHSERLVVGKNRNELIKKFGYVLTLDQTSTYNRFCYDTASYWGKEVLFLRSSNYMVVMQDGKVTDLVLLKGC